MAILRAVERTPYRWVTRLLVLTAVALVPWTLVLGYQLPSRHTTHHWDVAWVGFDIVLAASFAVTALAVARRSLWAEAAAAVTATLLLTDAWFDNILSSGAHEHLEAALEAVFGELPLALVCLWLARNCEHVIEAVQAAARSATEPGARGRSVRATVGGARAARREARARRARHG
jgi:hypothetical protein